MKISQLIWTHNYFNGDRIFNISILIFPFVKTIFFEVSNVRYDTTRYDIRI